MKSIFALLLASSLLLPAQDQPAPDRAGDESAKRADPQFVTDLRNLTDEQEKEYLTLFRDCERLFGQRRIFECLAAIHKINKIYAGNPSTINLEGACYVEFRAFDKAREAFERAMKVQPDNFNVRFNLAEIEFVTQNWPTALEKLTALNDEANQDQKNQGYADLIQFKMALCMLKLDDLEGAEKIVSKTTFLDDSPLHYYGNAALAYYANRGAEAETWLSRASRIFQGSPVIAPWQDTLIEFGYIKSFYGGDLEVESGPPNDE